MKTDISPSPVLSLHYTPFGAPLWCSVGAHGEIVAQIFHDLTPCHVNLPAPLADDGDQTGVTQTVKMEREVVWHDANKQLRSHRPECRSVPPEPEFERP